MCSMWRNAKCSSHAKLDLLSTSDTFSAWHRDRVSPLSLNPFLDVNNINTFSSPLFFARERDGTRISPVYHGITAITIGIRELRLGPSSDPSDSSDVMNSSLNSRHLTSARIHVALIKPVLQAYALGYLSSTGPRLVGFLRTIRRKDKTVQEKIDYLLTILKTSTETNRFPTSCAVIVAGATLVPRLITAFLHLLSRILKRDVPALRSPAFLARLRFLCTFLSAWQAFALLNRDGQWTRRRAQSRSSTRTHDSNLNLPDQRHFPLPKYHPRYAGKTIDFTLFALVRAVDVLTVTAWTGTRSRSWYPEHKVPRLAKLVKNLVDPSIFATSAAIIMWSWFYSPDRLPKAYNQWISRAAEIDSRLIEALRRARHGEFVYGQETGQAPLLSSMCKDLRLPEEWGDPTKTIPIPCELVHMGSTSSCEKHALARFWRGFKFSMSMYLPLQLVLRLRSPSLKSLKSAFAGAAGSSAFLAAFISSFYYGVCASRTRLGPKIFSSKTVTPQMWDSGLCVLAGSILCGWSIILEKPARRTEVSMFVAPRALATLLPRVYDKRLQSREQAVFALSVAVVMSAAKNGQNEVVRGVLGRVLQRVVGE